MFGPAMKKLQETMDRVTQNSAEQEDEARDMRDNAQSLAAKMKNESENWWKWKT